MEECLREHNEAHMSTLLMQSC